MIAIIFGILKWIGIALLWILGLTLALLVILLVVPVRYRFKGARRADDGSLWAGGKASWLLSILAVTFSYDQAFSWKVRILGVPLKLGQTSAGEESESGAYEAAGEGAKVEFQAEEELTPEQLAQITWWDHDIRED